MRARIRRNTSFLVTGGGGGGAGAGPGAAMMEEMSERMGCLRALNGIMAALAEDRPGAPSQGLEAHVRKSLYCEDGDDDDEEEDAGGVGA